MGGQCACALRLSATQKDSSMRTQGNPFFLEEVDAMLVD